jgi:hypothetical protein
VGPGKWVIARDVEELLGERGVRQLDTVEAFTCVCGVRDRVDAGPVSVYMEVDQVEGGPLCTGSAWPILAAGLRRWSLDRASSEQ